MIVRRVEMQFTCSRFGVCGKGEAMRQIERKSRQLLRHGGIIEHADECEFRVRFPPL